MARTNGTATRNRILDAAEQLFLEHGYGGTSIDAILGRTGVTKGAFFHHFDSKHALAHALIERYSAEDRALVEENVARAERLGRDPLQQLLILVGLYEEVMESMQDPEAPNPGCLFASFCYESGLFGNEVNRVVRESVLHWREVIGRKLREAMAHHPPRMAIDPDDVADTSLAIIEGAFILSRTLEDRTIMVRQLRQFRNYLELLFGVVDGKLTAADP